MSVDLHGYTTEVVERFAAPNTRWRWGVLGLAVTLLVVGTGAAVPVLDATLSGQPLLLWEVGPQAANQMLTPNGPSGIACFIQMADGSRVVSEPRARPRRMARRNPRTEPAPLNPLPLFAVGSVGSPGVSGALCVGLAMGVRRRLDIRPDGLHLDGILTPPRHIRALDPVAGGVRLELVDGRAFVLDVPEELVADVLRYATEPREISVPAEPNALSRLRAP